MIPTLPFPILTHRHIITPLRIMSIQPLPSPFILRHNAIQRITHIRPYILVVILIQAQRAGRVLHEQIQQPGLVVLQLWQRVDDVGCYEVRAAAARRQGYGFLEPGGWKLVSSCAQSFGFNDKEEGIGRDRTDQDIVSEFATQIFGATHCTLYLCTAAGK
jgi:hypothetical protein